MEVDRLSALPAELALDILERVRNDCFDDIISCSLVSRHVRELCLCFLFPRVAVTWDSLQRFTDEIAASETIAPIVTCLHIKEASSKAEWSKDSELHEAVKWLPRLNRLEFKVAGSSSWMKYLTGFPRITYLVANSSAECDKEMLPSFDIGDLVQFANVTRLKLKGFCIRNDERELSNVSDLELVNCNWRYPFDLSEFGPQLERLSIHYTNAFQSFTYSERIKSLALFPPRGLKYLSFDFDVPSHQKPWHPLASGHGCTHLSTLIMRGFEIPGQDFYKNVPDSLKRIEIYAVSGNQRKIPKHDGRYDVIIMNDV
ncbi:hypothetical protein TRVA0_017S02278 [Trichomonascus vanleenenianus]|uniref:uncharacterized protein n=1 Tax=Trichomonascus vanleenenianus TaxID=2268995 RepID=UPI003ECB6DF6